jgi:hypothetical protein
MLGWLIRRSERDNGFATAILAAGDLAVMTQRKQLHQN